MNLATAGALAALSMCPALRGAEAATVGVTGTATSGVAGVWLDLGPASIPPDVWQIVSAVSDPRSQQVVAVTNAGLRYRDSFGMWHQSDANFDLMSQTTAVVSDPDRGDTLVYGFCQRQQGFCYRPWIGSQMGASAISSGLPYLLGADIVYDPVRHQFVLAGGNSASVVPNLTTYVSKDGASWTAVPSDVNPGPFLSTGGMVFDPVIGEVVAIGGNESGCPRGCGRQTYLFDGTRWKTASMVPSSSPFDNLSTKLGYDRATQTVVALTQRTGAWSIDDYLAYGPPTTTFTFDGQTWTPHLDGRSPQQTSALYFDALLGHLATAGTRPSPVGATEFGLFVFDALARMP